MERAISCIRDYRISTTNIFSEGQTYKVKQDSDKFKVSSVNGILLQTIYEEQLNRYFTYLLTVDEAVNLIKDQFENIRYLELTSNNGKRPKITHVFKSDNFILEITGLVNCFSNNAVIDKVHVDIAISEFGYRTGIIKRLIKEDITELINFIKFISS